MARPHIMVGGIVEDVNLFGPGQERLAWAWDVASMGWLDDTRDALDVLAKHRDSLPGAVFFPVPDYAFEHPAWKEILDQSRPYCQCRDRRILWPGRGRSRLLPGCETVRLKQDRGGKPLAIVPHGGSLETAYVVWSFDAGDLHALQRPFMVDNRRNERQIWNQASVGQHSVYTNTWSARGFDVDDYLLRYGELAFMQGMPGPPNHRDNYPGWLPICSVVSMDFAGQQPDQYWLASIEVDPSVKLLTVVGNPRLVQKHVCQTASADG